MEKLLFHYKKVTVFTCFIGYAFLLIIMIRTPVLAQVHIQDENTLLLLHFNDNLLGTDGESPTQSTGITFEDGILGKGAYFSVGNQVFYLSADNIDSTEGTLEFWIKPRWDGNDGQGHTLLRYGGDGGMLFSKDGANTWRSILNVGGAGGNPEIGTGINIADEWSANEWHHAAFTWSSQSIKLYIDSELHDETPVTFPLPLVNDATFQIGANGPFDYLDAVIDELHISSIERSSQEIADSFMAGLTINNLTIQPNPNLITQPDTIEILETWSPTLQLIADTNLGTKTIPPIAADWSSSNPGVVSVDGTGRITGISAGNATITAEYNGVQDTLDVIVKTPVLPPEIESIDPYIATPASGHLYEMPVVILRYLPTQDGVNVDTDITGWDSTLEDLKVQIDRFNKRIKFKLEERSRFRGYKDPLAIPSLGYRVIHIVTVYEEFPPGKESPGNPGNYFPDYNQILTRFNAENFVNNQGVKEFWIWGYHHGNMAQPESNMSSPTTGDISNSSRFNDDLPIFNKTYVLYGYNFTRTQAEAVHNHGHQLEAILSHVNWLKDGNLDFFWKKFVGQDENGDFITGRCGWTHMPPNTTDHYDYYNPTLVESDIEDWTPDRIGDTTVVNVDTWGNLVYSWPDGETDFHQRIESQFYLYWMQSMPGYGNIIRNGNNYMTNWWEFTADWDKSITSGLGLYGAVLKDDLLGTWNGQGVYYRNSDTGGWVNMATPATQITAGEIDNDGIDDLLGIWPGQGGVWVKYSSSSSWALLSSTAEWIGSGDMNGDGRDDFLGTWSGQGVYYRNSAIGSWVKMATPASQITAGDLDDDGTDDLVGIWPAQGGVWVKYSSSGSWSRLSSTADWIACGDMNGDGQADLLGTWTGQGVFYKDSATDSWIKMATPATQIAAGDLDGDGMDDLLGIWPGQGGVWVKYSSDETWEKLSTTADWIACGKMRSADASSTELALTAPIGGFAQGPSWFEKHEDLSADGPGGWKFTYEEEDNLIPREQGRLRIMRVPGPGESGFNYTEQKNLFPREGLKINKDRKKK